VVGHGDECHTGDGEGAQHDGGKDDRCFLHGFARFPLCPKTLGWV
jgi:hypothetical protein